MKQVYRSARATVVAKENDLRVVMEERQEHLNRLAELGDGPLDLPQILGMRRHLNQLSRQESTLAVDLEELIQAAQSTHEQLTRAARDREAVERLRDRRRAEYDERVRRVEANELDEIARSRHQRITNEAER